MGRRTYSSTNSWNNRQNHCIGIEQLEARMLLALDTVDSALATLSVMDSATSLAEHASAVQSSNGPGHVGAAPVVVTPITVRSVSPEHITAKKISLNALGSDERGERSLRYRWELTNKPDGSTAYFSKSDLNAAKKTDLVFDRAGNYTIKLTVVNPSGESTETTQNVTVAPVLTSFAATYNGSLLRNNSTLKSAATSQAFVISAIDQFGRPMDVPSSAIHTLDAKPTGSNAQLTVNGGQVKVDFDQIGRYTYRVVSAENKVLSLKFDVASNLASIRIAAPKTQLATSESVSLTVQGTDQFGNPVARLPKAVWAVSAGATISSSGKFTAPTTAGSFTVSAQIGQFTAQISLQVGQAPTNSDLDGLVQSYFADGSISRTDMIAILRSVSSDGKVETDEISKLRTLVSSAGSYNVPGYVQVLASNVVNSNPANLRFQGTTLGNLTTGNTGPQLDKLVDKWFLGVDRPEILAHSGAGTITYASASGSLFNGTPKLTDQRQGLVGDCYLISSLGSIADVDPDAIKNMFIDNRDGTFTVRFYSGTLTSASNGFAAGTGVADYVTVDLSLPKYSNASYFAYSNFGLSVASTTAPLWIALAEKAYAQWNETGRAGRDGTNSYRGIEGGWMGITYAQILGYNSSNFSVASASAKSTLISQLNGGHAVTIGTQSSSSALVGGHAYTVSGYDSATDRFTLFNPWGNTHPSPMTWAQIQANCDWFSTINPSNFTPNVQSGGGQLAVAESIQFASGGDVVAITHFVFDFTSVDNRNFSQLNPSNEASFEMNHDSLSIAITEVLDQEADFVDDALIDDLAIRDLVHMEIFADIDALLEEALS